VETVWTVSFARPIFMTRPRADQAVSLSLSYIGMGQLSSSLKTESAKYKRAARNINLQAMLRKWAPVGGIGFFTILFLWWRFF
jgi:hypothetical protein